MSGNRHPLHERRPHSVVSLEDGLVFNTPLLQLYVGVDGEISHNLGWKCELSEERSGQEVGYFPLSVRCMTTTLLASKRTRKGKRDNFSLSLPKANALTGGLVECWLHFTN